MINRRFMIVPPALSRGGHAEQLGQPSEEFSRLRLETANMRVPAIVKARVAFSKPSWPRLIRPSFAARTGIGGRVKPGHDVNGRVAL
jgi:hypothetical protein